MTMEFALQIISETELQLDNPTYPLQHRLSRAWECISVLEESDTSARWHAAIGIWGDVLVHINLEKISENRALGLATSLHALLDEIKLSSFGGQHAGKINRS